MNTARWSGRGGHQSACAAVFRLLRDLSAPLIPILTMYLLVSAHSSACGETCFIDKNPLLLYKTINWWYSILPEESDKLCGKPISCQNIGDARVDYDETSQTLTIAIKGGFATMLSIFRECDRCCGPSHLRCTWCKQNYFRCADTTVRVDHAGRVDGFVFTRVEREAACRVQGMQRDLMFVVEGIIGGLSNGRIALHPAGDLIKTCGQASGKQANHAPISLKMLNANTKETLLAYDMVWEDCGTTRP
jgi:hypothetical protein